MSSDDDLSALVDTMFSTNRRGRLTGDAPHFYLLRTPRLVIYRCHADLAEDAAAGLASLLRRERGRPSLWAREYADYLAVLLSVAPLAAVRVGPLYGFPQSAVSGGAAVHIGRGNVDLLLGGLDEWVPDVAKGLPVAAVVADGRAVSICASIHASRTSHCAGVETLPGYRGKGLGAQAVAAWFRMVQASGATAFYGTTFDNVASQGLAKRLALDLIGAEFSVSLEMGKIGTACRSRFVPQA